MRTFLLALLLGGFVAPAGAQNADPDALTIGLGVGGVVQGGTHVAGYVSHQRGPLVGTVRVTSNGLYREVPNGDLFSNARDFATEAAVLVGVGQRLGGRWRADLSAGVSTVRVRRPYPRCILVSCDGFYWNGDADVRRVGLPLEARVYRFSPGGLGAGLRVFANVNAEESYAGVALDVRLNPLQRRSPR